MRTCSTLRSLGFAALIGLGGCAQQPANVQPVDPEPPAQFDPELLTGQVLFGEPVSSNELGDVDALALDDDMQAFVDIDSTSGLSVEKDSNG